jgi:hypothetical protein
MAMSLKGELLTGDIGSRTAFVQLKQGQLSWWEPLALNIKEPIEIIADAKQPKNSLQYTVVNNTDHVINGSVEVNRETVLPYSIITIPAFFVKKNNCPAENVIAGSNEVVYTWKTGM